jgi:hypothetical protein
MSEWAAAQDGGGSTADWDSQMAARRHEAATHKHRMGETSFPWGFVFLGKQREWSEAFDFPDVLMVALSKEKKRKYNTQNEKV